MDGIHDLGGKAGYGAVEPEVDEPPFHARWEAQVFTFLAAGWRSGAIRNVDQFRHAIERVDPSAYLTQGYYGRWLGGLETLFVEAGVLEREAIDAADTSCRSDSGPLIASRPNSTPELVSYEASGPGARRVLERPARFAVGDQVRTQRQPSRGHTRLPAYARGVRGTIVGWHGAWVLPDTNAHGKGECPTHLYTVRFAVRELFGPEAEAGSAINIDLFEPYLDAAPASSGADSNQAQRGG